MKRINYFIGKTYKAINIVNGLLEIFMQQPHSRVEGRTVRFRCNAAALMRNSMKQVHHVVQIY